MAEINEINQIIETKTLKIKKNNKYSEILNKYFKFVVILVLIIVLFIGYYFVIIPKWEIKSNKEIALTSIQNEVNKLKVNSDYLSKYSSQIIKFTPDEERKLNLALPSEFDMASIVTQLTRLASEHKFIVDNISANEASASVAVDSHLKRIDVEMSVSSTDGNDYGNFGKFIESLESSLLIFDVRAISFNPEEVGYKLELSTYYYPIK